MKKQITVLLALTLSLLAYGEFEVPHISVYGTAESKVTPDELYWNVSLNTKGKEVDTLAPEHMNDVSAVLEYLEANGVEDKDVKTSHMQLNENWEYRNQSRLKVGYYAYTQITFKTTDFEEYVRLWTELARFRNITIDNVTYGVSDYIAIQKKTRIDAVKAAKTKATELAEVLGVDLSEPLLLEEITPGMDTSGSLAGNAIYELQSLKAAPPRSMGGVSPGQESISMRVKVVYRITGG